MGIIYKATFKNGKSYVGLTTKSLHQRQRGHFVAAMNGSEFLFHKAIRKYGWENVSWEIVHDNVDDQELKSLEIQTITENKTHYTENGYNMTIGGDGGPTYWFESMTEQDYQQWYEKVMPYFSKTWSSKKRFAAIKDYWDTAVVRKEELREQMKTRWAEMPEEEKNRLKSIQSEKRKEAHKKGVYKDNQKTMTEKARLVVLGTKWYNDGSRNYRLHPSDEKTKTLNIGKLNGKSKSKHDE